MTRVRVSTTVDGALLSEACRVSGAGSDSVILDEALRALVERHRRDDLDQAYSAYDERPLDEPDEWGDVASFRSATATS